MLSPHTHTASRRSSRERGSAIVIVLAVLILVVALLVAFLSNANREIQSADVDRRGVRASDLARTAVELVTSQLRDGTSRGPGFLWATQPGLLRTYGTDGTPDISYKLFSDDQMSATGASYKPDSDLPPETWRDAPHIYTDLNEQVAESFPVLDPRALGRVVGFSIGDSSSPAEDIAAMPVTWLYVLADGSIVSPSPSSTEGQIIPIAGATKTNAIIGRIAFWTDDDSTKINVNTAGGDTWPDKNGDGITDDPTVPGAYYDTPRYSTNWDMRNLDARSPFDNEFQRTPGHPATTYLSAAFPSLDDEQLWSVLPKLQAGGTAGGRKSNSRDSTPKTIALDSDRLYATIDELAFTPEREPQDAISPGDLSYASFFLTTDATSPDTTPFGTPKISLWPLHRFKSRDFRSTYDRAVAFCHEFGGEGDVDGYYFVRSDPLKPHSDFHENARNPRLYNYLVNLTTTPLPGFGGTFELKYSPHDNRQILTSIYDYIRTTNLRDRSDGRLNPFAPNGIVYPTQIDFEGGSTAGLGRFETVSEFGYLIHQASEPRRRAVKNPAGENVTITERDIRAAFLWETVCLAQGLVGYRQNQIVKIDGLDQLHLDAEDGQDFYINGKLASQRRTENPDAPPGVSLSLPASVEMTLNAPATSAPESHPWGGTLSPALNMLYNASSSPADTADIRVFGEEGETGYPLVSSSSVRIGTDVDAEISLRDVRLKFTGATIKFNFFSNDGEETPLGSYSFELPSVGELPLPLIRRGATPRSAQFRLNSRLALGFDSGGKNSGSGLPWHDLIQPTDIVRTIQPAGRSPGSNVGPSGDLRHLAVLSMTNENGLPSQAFHPRIDFDDTNPSPLPFDSPDPQTRYRCLHSFSTNGGLYFPMQNDTAAFGSLLKGAKADYHHGTTEELIYYQAPGRIPDSFLTTRRPNFSDNIDGARLSNGLPGDWDTGTGFTSDGPFVNKLDDGTVLLPATLDSYFYGTPQENAFEPGQYHPNRMVTSAASFGSLPTGIHRGKPWETLLFNPCPASGNDHPSLQSGPPDHLFLEFFHMPVVSPYPLSTPAATAGRVNINTQIAPFTHIHRDTALYAALAAHRVTVVPRRDAASYKTATEQSTASNDNYRLPLDLDLTVEGIRRRFDEGKIFRTASQICEEFLVPASLSGTRMFEKYDREKLVGLWSNPSRSGLSGDNVREAPYAHLYPKITARSNSFTVHVRAQVITKVRSSLPTAFDPKRDRVDGEWRGSFGLRRQLDPTDDRIPDYAVKNLSSLGSANGEPTLDELHQIHITNVRRFNPRPTKDYQ